MPNINAHCLLRRHNPEETIYGGKLMNHRHALSAIELDVLQRVARGHTNRRISHDIWRSLETIRSHCKHIYAKLGARNRAHAVAIAYHIGLFQGRQDTPVNPFSVTPLGRTHPPHAR